MSYKIPDNKLLSFIIKKVIKEKKVIKSQKNFLNYVLEELRSSGIDYRLDGKRLRKIAINDLKLKVDIEYRESNEESKDLKICPVCGNKLMDIKNLTLDGKTVFTGKKCTKCSYWTGLKKRIPKKYTFYGDGEYDKQKKRKYDSS
ncbi:MAG: hypothetical protein ACP5LA_02170 [Thermoplasmata archaeon]|nr:hypothetical protein [Thermoplasmata archaeon]